MPAGRKPKPRRSARYERLIALRSRLVNLCDELRANGITLPEAGPIQLTEPEPDIDPKTNAKIGKVKEPVGVYIQRASVVENQSQRPGFDHLAEPVYLRLIWDFMTRDALLPESKVAALGAVDNTPVEDLEGTPPDQIKYSVIDGLQRLNCILIAILLVLWGEELVKAGLVTADAWEYFRDAIAKLRSKHGSAKAAVEHLLRQNLRYEVFYNIDLAKLVSYMVTFNTAQKRMSLQHQLEIMQQPLIRRLHTRIDVFDDLKRLPGMSKPKDQFAATDLLLAIQAFVTADPQVSAEEEAERLLDSDDFTAAEELGDNVDDVFDTLRFICSDVQRQVVNKYEDDPGRTYILSHSKIFLIGMCAACGHIHKHKGMKELQKALDMLLTKVKSPGDDDPLNLDDYTEVSDEISSSRGKTLRNLVYATFKQYFYGSALDLDWKDSLSFISK
jgi:hypothetical protein